MIEILLEIFLFLRFCCCKVDQCDAIFCYFIHQALICGVFSLVELFHHFQNSLDLLL